MLIGDYVQTLGDGRADDGAEGIAGRVCAVLGFVDRAVVFDHACGGEQSGDLVGGDGGHRLGVVGGNGVAAEGDNPAGHDSERLGAALGG
ncbi:Uncharacterised protein [Mycobacteroides abscessus subsp. abscessus]|nr:Uncharacterised protein [Mycobacteroides abscessus subsp. abscessus]